MIDPLSAFMQKKTTMPIPVQQSSQDSGKASSFDMLKQVRSSPNQMGMLRMLAMRNPQLRQVLDLVDKNGGDAKSLFYKLCEEKNVDPETILSQLR